MSAPQLAEWMAFDAIEPIGAKRGDWQAAAVCAAIMNARVLGTDVVFKPKDFMLEFSDEPQKEERVTKSSPASKSKVNHMKWIAMQQTALANADEKKRRKKR